MLVYDSNLELQEKSKDNIYSQKVNKAISFNAIKHKAFDIFFSKKDTLVQMKELEELFMSNTVIIRPNRETVKRLDKEKDKTTIATRCINYLERRKKSLGN